MFRTGGGFANRFHTDIVNKNRDRNKIRKQEVIASKGRPVYGEWIDNPETPLHNAVEKGDVKEVAWLLRHNVDVRAVDGDGRTALHCAVVCDNNSTNKISILKMVLRHMTTADVLIANHYGMTPLHYAASQPSDVMRILIQYIRTTSENELPAYLDCVDHFGETPLFEAVHLRNVPMVELILEFDVDSTRTNGIDNTALHEVATLDRYDDEEMNPNNAGVTIAALLLHHDTRALTMHNNEGMTPLQCAVKNGSKMMVNLLEYHMGTSQQSWSRTHRP
jgi:ankyrin repeat protein